MIIVEGPEGCGKTEFARKIARDFGLKYEKPLGPAPRDMQRSYVYEALEHAVGGNEPVKVYDRFFFSEIVYGPVLRGGPAFSPTEISFIQRIIQAAQFPVFLCKVSKETAQANHAKDMGESNPIEHDDAVMTHWDELWDSYNDPHVDAFVTAYVDFENPTSASDDAFIRGHISEYLDKRRERTG